MSEVLSQNEIDALLQALSSGEVDAQKIRKETEEMKIKEYDFRRPNKFAKDQLRTLQIIYENFSMLLKNFLSAYLRTVVHVEVLSVEQLTSYEFMNAISNPAVLGVVDFLPLEGQILLDVSPDISFVCIDRILGGYGQPIQEKRTFTEIELSLLKQLFKRMLRLLKEPWENVVDLDPRLEKIETNSQFAQIVSPSETIALITMNVKIGETEGMFNMCIPHLVIEPILPKINTKYWFATVSKEKTSEDEKKIAKKVEKARVSIKAVLGKAFITVGELMDLQVGDVIQLDTTVHSPVNIFVEDELKFYGKPGRTKKKMAVQIMDLAEERDE